MDYGHFTTMLVEKGARVRGLDLHLDRLRRDSVALFGAALDQESIRDALRHAVDGGTLPVVARVTIEDPALIIAHPDAARPQVAVTLRPAPGPPAEPLRVRTTVFARELPHIKHTGLMAALYQRRQAQLNGFDDALFVTADGTVSEGVTWNAGFAGDDGVVWPDGDALTGVTATLLAGVAAKSRRAPVRRADLGGTRAAFATNAVIGVRPIAGIDAVALDAAHPLLAELAERYLAIDGQPI